MSKHEVVTAYLEGRIDRREFVRRLTMAGVSAAAAVAYAQTLSQPAAARGASRTAQGFLTAIQQTPDYQSNVDSDGDGFTDAQEIACGSDPFDPNSTCGNVNTPPCSRTTTFSFVVDLTIDLGAGGNIVINAGSTLVFNPGGPSGGGCTSTSWTFNGRINGQAASFTVTATLRVSGAAAAGAVRALVSPTQLVFEITAVSAWAVPGVPKPVTPRQFPLRNSGGTLVVTAGGKQTIIAVSPNLEVPFKNTTDYRVGPLNRLPTTGVGGGPAAGNRWLTPVALAGAGAALVARRLRRATKPGD